MHSFWVPFLHKKECEKEGGESVVCIVYNHHEASLKITRSHHDIAIIYHV